MSTAPPDRPNLLFILTDQQNAQMLSCAGNRYLHTPAMDSLAAEGVRFERAYCTDPLCVPSRFSLMTGRMPSAIGLRGNNARHIEDVPEEIQQQGLGWLLRDAGYEVAYGGKEHLPRMRATDLGFEYITDDERDELARVCADFVRRPHDRPFFLVASFINPHDICYMAIRDQGESDLSKLLIEKGELPRAELDAALRLPEGVDRETFLAEVCPPLPPNFEPQQDEPEALRMMQAARPFKQKARQRWSEEQWRLHRWAYARLTERVDGQIGQVLDALRESGQAENTVVIFTSDHGDMDAAHRMEHKTAFYEEACRIPLLVAQAGTPPAGVVDREHLVSNGLDLLPTLCDYAGVAPPAGLRGHSIRPLAEGRTPSGWRTPAGWRTSVPIESPYGYAVVTQRYKYALYDEDAHREQLLDLEEEPPEMRNAAHDPANQEILQRMRAIFQEQHAAR
jgi:choline-sulfatase